MLQPKTHRKVTIGARVASGWISGASMVLFIVILYKVLDPRFPAESTYYSVLPVGALAANIFWNIIALVTINKFGRFVYIIGDSITTVLVIILGAIGFAHDDNMYLRNALYLQYDNFDWLTQATCGGILMIVAVILQLSLIGWGLMTPARVQASGHDVSSPPAYGDEYYEKDVKEKQIETDWQSISTLEIPPNIEKKM